MTDGKKGMVFYDADCAICTTSARRAERLLHTRGIVIHSLQDPWVAERLGRTHDQLMQDMHLLLPDGRVFAGADAFVELSRRWWWGWPLYLLAKIPGARPVLQGIYRRFADNRRCLDGVCRIPQRPHRTITFFEMP